jgi:hypothetical protein
MEAKRVKWKADGVEIQEIGHVDGRAERPINETAISHIVRFKNLKINPDSKRKPIFFEGNSFLATLHYFYHHTILDMMGEYFFIKAHVSDLKCYFNSLMAKSPEWRDNFEDRSVDTYLNYLKKYPFGANQYNETNYHEFTRDLVNIFSPDKQIYTTESDSLIFENFYIVVDLPTPFAGKSYPQNRDIESLSIHLSELCEDKDLPKKIYVSRQMNNIRYKNELKQQPTQNPQANARIRVFEKENLIEEYFNSIGYQSVILEGMSMLDQLNLFYNATHIAGLNGSAWVNLLASKEKTNIIELNLIDGYANKFNYKNLYNFKNFNFIDYHNVSGNVEEIIKELNFVKDID